MGRVTLSRPTSPGHRSPNREQDPLPTSPRSRRTIVLVMVDQLAAKWLEVARDHNVVDLPNFDAMQAEGVTFTRAFTPNPVCSPARASLATGMPTPSHGLTECGYRLDPSVPTFMQSLQSQGWRTGAFGKLHLIPQLEALRPDYRPYGFDVTHITEDSRVGEWTDWVADTHPEHYDAALATVWMTMIRELKEYGPTKEDLRARVLAARERYPECTQEAYVLPYPGEVSQTAWITDRALDFLDSADDRDVFAQVSYVQPHNPFTPPPEYVDRVRTDNIPEPVEAEWVDAPIPYYRQERYARPSYEERDWRRDRQLYFADLAHLDHELGRIREALVRTGRVDGALVMFTSDHGELLHDHGLLGKWERHYDACIRVPLIVTAPGTHAARDCDAFVDLTDIAATVYDWAGLPHPSVPLRDNGTPTMGRADLLTGRSLWPHIVGVGQGQQRDHVLVQSNNSHLEVGPRSWARTLRTDRYRYSRHLSGGGEQLFDLRADPDEQRNLAYDKAHESVRTGLLELLAEASVTDAFPSSPRELYQLGSW
ncbi:sulfatase [Terrabacter sp. GCM10028922]|uniref:sulfatase family protein n=1 Tax=Terrabacter sp. GCM10028922 TaxID=3273428 RepID=UPI0036128241